MHRQLHVVDSCIFTCAVLFISITGCFFLTVHLVLPSAFIQYHGLSVLTANLRESLSVPGCQYCFTCAHMAAKSWSELGMTCVCQHVCVYLLYLFISQCSPLAEVELQNIRRFQAVFVMKCKHPHSVINCVCTGMVTSSALCILLMLKGCTQLQVWFYQVAVVPSNRYS